MLRAAIALAVATAVAGVASCLVTRKSTDFECDNDTNCAPDRMCERGYCVERTIDPIDANGCPGVCPGCDLVTRTCPIECNTVNGCHNVTCPAGFDCTINCTKSNACSEVDCQQARSCTVNCTVSGACDDVTCGTGPCRVSCSANNACQNVVCRDSCRCDVACNAGNDCQSTSCPMGTAKLCTEDGTANTSCSSMMQLGCSTCP